MVETQAEGIRARGLLNEWAGELLDQLAADEIGDRAAVLQVMATVNLATALALINVELAETNRYLKKIAETPAVRT